MYHPFMPSITEELWQSNNELDRRNAISILDSKYPSYSDVSPLEIKFQNSQETDEFIRYVRSVITSVFSFRRLIDIKEKPKSKELF
jgi:valyl-tRNA synthetase